MGIFSTICIMMTCQLSDHNRFFGKWCNSFFANEYSNQIQINEDATPETDSFTSRVEQGAVHSITESEYAELTGEDLDVPALEKEKKEGILSKAISFFTKIFKIEKEVELEETKAPERVDGSAADTKKSR